MQRLAQHLPVLSSAKVDTCNGSSSNSYHYEKKRYLELEHVYKLSLSNKHKHQPQHTHNPHFQERVDIVDFLYKVVDYYNESREIVQIAMNYLDRYLAKNAGAKLQTHSKGSHIDTCAVPADTAITNTRVSATPRTNTANANATINAAGATSTPNGKAATQSCGISNTTRHTEESKMQNENHKAGISDAISDDSSSNADSATGTISPSTVIDEFNGECVFYTHTILRFLSSLSVSIPALFTYICAIEIVFWYHDFYNHSRKCKSKFDIT